MLIFLYLFKFQVLAMLLLVILGIVEVFLHVFHKCTYTVNLKCCFVNLTKILFLIFVNFMKL